MKVMMAEELRRFLGEIFRSRGVPEAVGKVRQGLRQGTRVLDQVRTHRLGNGNAEDLDHILYTHNGNIYKFH